MSTNAVFGIIIGMLLFYLLLIYLSCFSFSSFINCSHLHQNPVILAVSVVYLLLLAITGTFLCANVSYLAIANS